MKPPPEVTRLTLPNTHRGMRMGWGSKVTVRPAVDRSQTSAPLHESVQRASAAAVSLEAPGPEGGGQRQGCVSLRRVVFIVSEGVIDVSLTLRLTHKHHWRASITPFINTLLFLLILTHEGPELHCEMRRRVGELRRRADEERGWGRIRPRSDLRAQRKLRPLLRLVLGSAPKQRLRYAGGGRQESHAAPHQRARLRVSRDIGPQVLGDAEFTRDLVVHFACLGRSLRR